MTELPKLKIEKKENGCSFCMEYDWENHVELPKKEINVSINGKKLVYCPFCGRYLG